MHLFRLRINLPRIFPAALLAMAGAAGSSRAGEAEEFFEKRIRPVLVEHCHECHSADAKKIKGGLRLDSRAAILKGGDTGVAVAPGEPEKSLLISAVSYADKDLKMPPPKDGLDRKLSGAQIADLTEWIRMGAPVPELSTLNFLPLGVSTHRETTRARTIPSYSTGSPQNLSRAAGV